jgi:hypothetical protein
LRAYEARVVVRRGINQMADDLLARPLAGGTRHRGVSIRDRQHPFGAARDRGPERLEEGRVDRHATSLLDRELRRQRIQLTAGPTRRFGCRDGNGQLGYRADCINDRKD